MAVTPPTWSHGSTITFQPPGRNVHTVFVHCSASDRARDDDVSVMRRWHVNGNGWNDVGYHYFITKQGHIQAGRPVGKIPAAQYQHNSGTIAICLHGLKEGLFTSQQFQSLIALCKSIDAAYPDKKLRFRGHREVANKACPVFNYKLVLGLDGSGYMTGSTNPAASPAVSPPPAPRPDDSTQTFDKGKPVIALQSVLVLLGENLKIDGIMGQITTQAVKTFQKKAGLSVENGVNAKTKAALVAALGQGPTLQKPTSGNKVKALQHLLKLAGSNLKADGSFGNITKGAVEKFQQANGLSVTGIADPKTLAALAKKLLGG
ncbi:MAG: N-acetylmuramoyl-L-alanine amidase [Candidatus Competibacteraceae bacterium]|jgi:peptidoglycan hydrolase-like protein with peptidoglycan-binding domain|nr:N-acetylmuramoyl-L-alanine amidase [Candidatus Competibacteraceae bacterium]